MNRNLLALVLSFVAPVALSSPYRVVGTIPTVIHTNSAPVARSSNSTPVQDTVVRLMKVQLTPEAQNALVTKVNEMDQPSLRSADVNPEPNELPPKQDLGMNNVPVLNQGAHGSCVTFAVSAALDALIGRGDYISQLCSLELGSTLEAANSHYPSGWEGSDAPIVFKQFQNYGLINRDKEAAGVCMGVTSYPLYSSSEGKAMPVSDYRLASEPIPENTRLDAIVDVSNNLMTASQAEKALKKIKTSINQGNRVMIGTLLDIYVDNRDGAVGQVNRRNDTWMMVPAIKEDIKKKIIDAAHEMVITGYDDTLVATGPDGIQETGVLILRNSWGTNAGDHGTYYMTYAHFKALGLDVQGIH